MTEPLPLVDAALRGALAATVLLLGATLLRGDPAYRGQPARRTGVALMAGLAVQSFAGLPGVEHGWPIVWQAPLVGLSVGNSVLFWLFARALFDDDFSIGAAEIAAWLVVFGIGAGFCVSLGAFGSRATFTLALRLALRWAPAIFALLVIVAAISQWRVDLVQRRRRLRVFIVVGGSAYALAMVALRVASPTGMLSADSARFDVGVLLLIVFIVALTVLRVDPGELLPARAAVSTSDAFGTSSAAPQEIDAPTAASAEPAGASPPVGAVDAPDAIDERIAKPLDHLMVQERVYRIDDLTLGLLALKLAVPEYRLRRFINLRLGHRNFNAYVNGLRLAEARAALADPACRNASVLEIAMAAGFASIGPFNRGFKATSGMTPTEFRRRALAES